jgi:hypothetical protein
MQFLGVAGAVTGSRFLPRNLRNRIQKATTRFGAHPAVLVHAGVSFALGAAYLTGNNTMH